jgi:predicted Zn-dependent peptidase
MSRTTVLTAFAAVAGALSADAQSSAYPKPPVLPSAAALAVPPVKSSTLPNGITLRVVEQHELPLAQVTLVVPGGSRLDGNTAGLASFMANMLSQGAGTRDAATLQSEFAFLGASFFTSADWDRFTVSLKVPVRSLAPALDLMADVVRRPTFRAAEVRRQRDLRLTSLLQLRDQPNALADLAFNQILFPEGHPYRASPQGDSLSVAAFDSASVRAFYSATIRPERATVIVVGDVTGAQVHELFVSRFGGWSASGIALPLPASAAAPAPAASSRVFLVDKPDAAQSVIVIGWSGVDRRSPDYAALIVMNTLLGGSFSSRLMTNLRETKGYTYGASSRFAWRVIPGPFTASAAVRTNVTDSSLVEFFKELRMIRETPAAEQELARGKAYVELGIPGALESTSQVAGQVAQLGVFGLTLDELPRFAEQVRAVTAADVQRVARQYLTPDQATIVVVGDLAKVRAGIAALQLGPITVLKVTDVAR